MRYCHECGEKIAEIDIFCPYRGITQIPVEGGEETAPDKTFIVNSSELADLASKKNEADAIGEGEKGRKGEREIDSDAAKKSGEKSSFLPQDDDEFSEKREINEESEQPPKVTVENW